MFDKLLASTREDTLPIAQPAQQHNAPIFSSSSLRYAVELEAELENKGAASTREMFARGMVAWNGYGIIKVC